MHSLNTDAKNLGSEEELSCLHSPPAQYWAHFLPGKERVWRHLPKVSSQLFPDPFSSPELHKPCHFRLITNHFTPVLGSSTIETKSGWSLSIESTKVVLKLNKE